VGERVAIDEHLGVAAGQPVAPRPGDGGRVVDVEDPRDRLLLEPLACIPLVRLRRLGKLRRRRTLQLGERAVQAEPVAEVDGEQLVGAERSAREPLRERVRRRVTVGSRKP
jgi:hypothetical protein